MWQVLQRWDRLMGLNVADLVLASVAKVGQANGCQTWQIGCRPDVEM